MVVNNSHFQFNKPPFLTLRYLFLIFTICVIHIFLLYDYSFSQTEHDEQGNGKKRIAEEEKPSGLVELDGDSVEYSVSGNTVLARGNVIIKRNGITIYADEVDFSRDTNLAHARGNVRFVSKQGEITGRSVVFNFKDMTGNFHNVQVMYKPFYGAAKLAKKVDENKLVLYEGYITTSDFDKPEYRIASRKIDVYPGDKMIANNNRLLAGNLPLMYIPRFVQNLNDTKPRFIIIPGHDKDWGTFALSQWRYFINENLKGVIHLDYRDKLGFASGLDVDYKIPNYGGGIVRLYYTGERDKDRTPQATIERFKGEWRHKWDIDDNTTAIWQYYKISDANFLKDYFEREFDDDSNPDTFFLLTKRFKYGTFNYRVDARVNRFESKVERLPEVRYDIPNTEIANTNLFFRNTTTFSNLTKKDASPSEVRQKTMRLDSDNEISYPFKLSIFELRPFVGERSTYYTKTKDREVEGSIRGIFRSGATLSTKFFRIFETNTDAYGLDVNRLRHIITPTVRYEFVNEPTISPDQLESFDGIDSINKSHSVNLSLENKLQTKRDNKSVDLMRVVVGTDFRLKEHPTGGGFDQVLAEIDITPTDWFALYFDSDYDTRKDHLDTANFDLYINSGNKWRLGVGKRFNRDADDQITTELTYRFNPKWAMRIFGRFDIDSGILKEQDYTLTRDLHTWEMDIRVNDTRNEGSEFLLLFRLKAFPEIGVDFGTKFNRRKKGSIQQ